MPAESLKAESPEINLNLKFVRLVRETVGFAKIAKSRLIGLSGPNLPHFGRLNHVEKLRVIDHLEVFNQICRQVLAEGKSLSDASTITWYALRRLNLIFPSDLFSFIDNSNIVEIYDRDNIQIFRNYNFFDVVSYTLEDLLCRPWPELFARVNNEHTDKLLKTCEKFYRKEITTVTSLSEIGMQRIEECNSPFSFKVDAVVNYLAPVYDKDRYPAGCIAIETATLTSEVPVGRTAERLLASYYNWDLEESTL